MPTPSPVFYDATLRDGAQALGITFSPAGKIRLAHLLDDFGVPYLEGGFAGSNERDMQFFRDAAKERFSQIRLVAFGATRRVGGSCKDDPLVQALLKAGTPAAAIYGKYWKLHVRDVLRTSEQENLDMVSETVEYLRARGLEVVFDAEHFLIYLPCGWQIPPMQKIHSVRSVVFIILTVLTNNQSVVVAVHVI